MDWEHREALLNRCIDELVAQVHYLHNQLKTAEMLNQVLSERIDNIERMYKSQTEWNEQTLNLIKSLHHHLSKLEER